MPQQVGTIISIVPYPAGNDWMIQYSYLNDSGVPQQALIVVGSVDAPVGYSSIPTPGSYQTPRLLMWASPTSTISVNAPGSSNPIILSCPDLVAFAVFGVPKKGIPFQQ